MTTATITLPFPLSVNNLYAGRRRRYPTKRYAAWRREAELMIMAAKPPRIRGPVAVAMTLHPFNRRKRDADNAWKCVLDACVRMNVIEADDQTIVRKASVEWGEMRPRGEAVVTITALER